MRMLIISPYFPPQNAVASLRAWSLARAWANAGEDVTVLTTAKRPDQQGLSCDYNGVTIIELAAPSGRLLERIRAWSKRGGASEGHARVAHSAEHAAAQDGVVRRLLRAGKERTGVFSSVRMPDLTDAWLGPARRWCAANGPWDAIISSAGPYTAHLVALDARRRGLTHVWCAEFRDLWVDNQPYRGLFPFTLRERVLEVDVLREADVLVTVGEALARRLAQKSGRAVGVVSNGYDARELDALPRERALPDDGRLRIVFTGTLYAERQDVSPLLVAMQRLWATRPDLADRIRLCVAGRQVALWSKLAARHMVGEMVELTGWVPRGQALRMQRDADALLLVDWNDPAHGVLTTKAFEYLHARGSVLVVGGAEQSALGQMVSAAGRGVHLGQSIDAVEHALTALIERRSLAGQRNETFISQFTREAQAERMLAMVRRAVELRRTGWDRDAG